MSATDPKPVAPHSMTNGSRRATNPRGPQLIAYADRLGGDLEKLGAVLQHRFDDVFDGVHVLPFFSPFDGADAGFDPKDHASVDPRLGNWNDVMRLAQGRRVMADLIVNHMSAHSEQFQAFVADGDSAASAPMFLTLSSIYPDGATEDELAQIYRPRPGLPFTPMVIGGRRRLVWTTFTPEQVDLDVRSAEFWDYLTFVIDTLLGAGITMIRLDAVGYTGKARGTSCFMTTESAELVERISTYVHAGGGEVLLEIHGHHQLQIDIARTVDYVYDFALPPLLLHALHTGNPEALHSWSQIRPRNAINVLDTHDGIGIIDVGPSNDATLPGLLTEDQLNDLVESIHVNSQGSSRLATGAAASNLDLYQVNCTYFDALGQDPEALLLARLVQLLLPGIPQVYYVGLLAGTNDVDRLQATGVGRDINRPLYSEDALAAAIDKSVVKQQLAAIRWRSGHPAFDGTFSCEHQDSKLHMNWTLEDRQVTAVIDFATRQFTVLTDGQPTTFSE